MDLNRIHAEVPLRRRKAKETVAGLGMSVCELIPDYLRLITLPCRDALPLQSRAGEGDSSTVGSVPV